MRGLVLEESEVRLHLLVESSIEPRAAQPSGRREWPWGADPRRPRATGYLASTFLAIIW
jgi:hypothetical protein